MIRSALLFLMLMATTPPTPVETAAARLVAAGYPAVVGSPADARNIAVYDTGTRTIYLNPAQRYWSDPATVGAELGRIRWLSTGDPDHIIRHEAAHADLHRALGTDRYHAVACLPPPLAPEVIYAEVGDYARTSSAEFHAEVAAGLKAGRKYGPEVMKAYREIGNP